MKKNKKEQPNLNDGTLEEVMADDFPRIYIHSMEELPEGGATMNFDTNKAFDESYKKAKGRKRVTQKGLGNYILEILQKGLDEEGGYQVRPLKDVFEGTKGK